MRPVKFLIRLRNAQSDLKVRWAHMKISTRLLNVLPSINNKVDYVKRYIF